MWLVFTILDIITESSIAEHGLWTKRRVKAQSPKSRCWGNNCRWLSTAAGQAIQRRYPGDEAGGIGQCRQLMVFLGLYYKIRRNQVLARSASHYQPVITALGSCMGKTFEQGSLVHQLCLWNHMSSGNNGNLPHHEIIIFLWKKIDFFF